MTIALEHASAPHVATSTAAAVSSRTVLVTIAGLASLGAGAIHAAAIGVHAESRPAALAFTATAALQLCWGGLALVRAKTPVIVAGMLLGVGAMAGWVLAKTSGISFIEGLNVAEPIQFVDAMAAAMALVSVVLLAVSLRASDTPRLSMRPRLLTPAAAVTVAALSIYGMTAAGTHVHAHGAGGDHVEAAGSGGDHDHSAAVPAGGTADHHASTPGGTAPPAHEHAEPVAVPYDPTKPIDLGGVEGVTLEEQASAENLVAVTLLRLPKWADSAVAEAAGFQSIGDGLTGTEHLINQVFMNDDVFLDPDQPESLVYHVKGGVRTLVAAMYMVKPGTPLADVPHVGGKLTQWHTHENLCYRPNGKLGGLTDAAGNCAPGLVKPPATPMIHVWVTPHKCGPFAALEGIGGGTIAEGEERLCDHAHGA